MGSERLIGSPQRQPADPSHLVVDVATLAATFGHRLHRAGLATTPERSARFAEMLALVSPSTTAQLYWTARLAYVTDLSALATFDAVFAEVFGGAVDVADILRNPNVLPEAALSRGEERAPDAGTAAQSGSGDAADGLTTPSADSSEADEDDENGNEAMVAAAAARDVLGSKPFGECTPEELEQLGRLIAKLPFVPPLRASRRTRRHRHRGDIHWRATLRIAHRTGGDPIRHVLRQQRARPRRVVLIADVSGSMEGYARAYLYLLHGAVRAVGAEAFVFSTRLTRLTRLLGGQHPQVALTKAMESAPDWSGGTRIGEALASFNDGWGRRGLARGAVVVIVSDGWEAGDTAVLGREMARLALIAERIVWVNPRRQSPRFQPVTGGMAIALPHVDHFVSGHSLAHLDEVLIAISAD